VPTKYILEGRALELPDYMKQGGNGQHTFDQSLLAMHKQELISIPEAMKHASNPESLGMALRGIGSNKPPAEQRQAPAPKPAPSAPH
jgi:Tfp pilus assembly ATPase PilU